MTHQDEYNENLVTMLELIWGKGYMAPGGPGNVAKLLNGIDTHGKRILDIGCGIGGPAFEMTRTHGAEVVGIDLEAPLIARANATADELGLSDRCQFHVVKAGPLNFPDQSFDIVLSSGAFTQIADKAGIFGESFRVLKPGGHVTCYDWLKGDYDEYSEDMLYWFKMEGLTYALQTLGSYAEVMNSVGFSDVSIEDASDWYREEAHREYGLMTGDLYPRMVERLGQKDADH